MLSQGESRILEVHRDAPLGDLTMVQERLPRQQRGGLLLAIKQFSLATNNIGYILFSDVLQTLDAFPASRPDHARIPVWGMAEVVASDQPEAPVGTIVTGFLPMATHAMVHATPTEIGLLSVDEQRAHMLPIYRRLSPVLNGSRSDEFDVETVLLPVTPFAALLAADVVAMGANAVVVSSASSRSAAALGRLLTRSGVGVIGLTNPHHRSAAESFGVYDRVFDYDEVDRLFPSGGTVYVDVAGSADITQAVHLRFGHHLTASISVGGTHARSRPSTSGPALSIFNTGDREQDFARDHGWQAMRNRYDDARADLIPWASRWLRVHTVEGLAAASPVWRAIVAGRTDPRSATVIRP